MGVEQNIHRPGVNEPAPAEVNDEAFGPQVHRVLE
jgi:hypothetical protein